MAFELHWNLLKVVFIEAFKIAQHLVKRSLFLKFFTSNLLACTQVNFIIALGSFDVYLEKAPAVELLFPQWVPQIICDEF